MRKLLVEGRKRFIITVPDDATVTFGPWSPPNASSLKQGYEDRHERLRGTLRIYKGKSKSDILACFSDVTSFRDMDIEYAEEVMVEKGETVWHSDEKGYHRESKVSASKMLIEPFKEDEEPPF
jgi:hypothetical protein